MGIKANFKMRDIERQMQGWVGSVKNAAAQALIALGKECVDYARANHTFQNDTGNLESSIGGKVFVDGKAVWEGGFVQVLEGGEGVEKGRALADAVGAKCGEGEMMLVIVAGMEYAVILESKGYDVTASAELYAAQQWPMMKARIDAMMRRAAR